MNPKPWRLLITGTRNHLTPGNRQYVINTITARGYGQNVVLVHGACPTGVDAVAHQLADDPAWPNFTEETHPADWDVYGASAGPIRNGDMVALGADECLAFPAHNSRGTRDCMKRARKAHIPTFTHLIRDN